MPIADFRLERVAAISCDQHKYGKAPKGVSCVLLKDDSFKECSISYHKYWTAGIYATVGFIGSKSAAPVIGAWISMKYLGMEGLKK